MLINSITKGAVIYNLDYSKNLKNNATRNQARTMHDCQHSPKMYLKI